VDKLNSTGTALLYQTFFGGGGGSGIAVDSAGDVYVTGVAGSNFPTTTNALQPTPPASGQAGFVTVLDPTGANLLYSTYLSGVPTNASFPWIDGPTVAISSAGVAPGALDNIYVTGKTEANLPTTANAFQATPGGGSGSANAFFVEINPNLSGSASLLYGSYFGDGGVVGTDIAVDGAGNAYITGYSGSIPTTPGAYQTSNGGDFVAKFDPSLSGSASLVFSTYLGGTGYYPDSQGPDFSYTDQQPGPAIAVDSAGDAYVTGITGGGLPTTSGAFQRKLADHRNDGHGDAFVIKLNPSGSALVYSTYLGGNGLDGGASIAVDSSGNAYVTGWTWSTNFPTANPIQSSNGGTADAFVTTLNSTGSGLLFSTYLGGSGYDYGYGIAVDSSGNAYVTGATYTGAFPTTSGALQTGASNAFVLKIDPPADSTSTGSAGDAVSDTTDKGPGGTDRIHHHRTEH
jgi:hypothetical protein